MELVIGRDEKELSSGVEGQRCDGNVALCKPTLTATLQKQSDTRRNVSLPTTWLFSSFCNVSTLQQSKINEPLNFMLELEALLFMLPRQMK